MNRQKQGQGQDRVIPTGGGVVWLGAPAFPKAAATALADTRLRANLRHATGTIRDKRLAVTAELADWEQLRDSGAALKRRVSRHLDYYLVQLEESVTAAGGVVHWAGDEAEREAATDDAVGGAGDPA